MRVFVRERKVGVTRELNRMSSRARPGIHAALEHALPWIAGQARNDIQQA
jgi:hypothetical protein